MYAPRTESRSSIFKNCQSGQHIPDYETRHEPEYYVNVKFPPRSKGMDSEYLIHHMIRCIEQGKASVTKTPLHSMHPRHISLPVYDFYRATIPRVIASAIHLAKKRLREIKAGVIEVDMAWLYLSL